MSLDPWRVAGLLIATVGSLFLWWLVWVAFSRLIAPMCATLC